MKRVVALALIGFLAACGTLQAEMWDVVADGIVVKHNIGEPHHNGFGNMSRDQHALFGEYEQLRQEADVPDGKYVSGWTWQGVEKGRSVYAPELSDIPPVVDPGPSVEDRLAAVEAEVAATKAVADKAAVDIKAIQDAAKEVPK